MTGEHAYDIVSKKIQIQIDSNFIKYNLYMFIQKSEKK